MRTSFSPPSAWRPSAEFVAVAELLLGRAAFPPSPVLAVSGGPDSVAMALLAWHAWQKGRCERPVIWTANHHLRAEADADVEFVEALGRMLDLEVHVAEAAVAPGPNLEDRARARRREALPVGALRAHTADDQAETVLLALGRGTGPAGARGIDPASAPLLELRREDLRNLCVAAGIEARHDAMNDDHRFTRVRVRATVLPAYSAAMGRDVVPLLARFAALMRAELADHEPADPGARSATGSTGARVSAAELREWRALAPAVLARRVRSFCAPAPSLSFGATQRATAVALGHHRACELSGGWRLQRRNGALELVAPAPPEVTEGRQQGGGDSVAGCPLPSDRRS